MATTQKAINVARFLEEELRTRFSPASMGSLAVTFSFDTDGNPLVKVGTGSIGAAGALFKIRPIVWPLATDVLGNPAISFGPHVIQIVSEANSLLVAVADINTPAQVLALLASASQRGMKIDWYNSANGNAPDASDIIAGNLVGSWESSLQYPMVQSQ